MTETRDFWSSLDGELLAVAPGYAPALFALRHRTLAESDANAARAASAAKRGSRTPVRSAQGSVAIVPLYGLLAQRAAQAMFPFMTNTQLVAGMLRDAIDDTAVSAIVLDVDSPGGPVASIHSLADVLYGLRGRKPLYAVANARASSGAFWIAAQADQLYATPSGEVGGLGVVAVHDDLSGALKQAGVERTFISAGPNKVEGNSAQPLSPEAKAYMQTRVDDAYRTQLAAVARARGANVADVRDRFGGGRMLGAHSAKDAGMVDGVATLDEVIERARRGASALRAVPDTGSSRMAALRADVARQEARIRAEDRRLELILGGARTAAH